MSDHGTPNRAVARTGRHADLVELTLSLDTNAYADGDVLAATQEITDAFLSDGGRAILQSIAVLDEDDQGVAMDLVFLRANGSIGAENGAVAVADADARDILGTVNIAAADYADLVNSQLATKRDVGLLLEAAAGSRSLYVAAISRGTPTHTASGIKLRLGLLHL